MVMIKLDLDEKVIKELECDRCNHLGEPNLRDLYLFQFEGKSAIVCEECITDIIEKELAAIRVI
ncbi:MAG: hypothetical protein ACTSPQ_21895 [Candidatus Helarchaeota archaeon]